MTTDNLEILTMIEDPERDDEDDNFEKIENNSLMYNMKEILDAIGNITDNTFEYLYNMFIEDIQRSDIESQKLFCTSILKRVEDQFEFQLLHKPVLENQEDCNQIYELINFIHVEFTKYIHRIVKGGEAIIMDDLINKNMLTTTIDIDILNNRLNKLASEQINNKTLVKDFLEFTDKELMLEVIIKHIRRSRTDILYNMKTN
jgi:hypothetical protein